MRLSSIKGRTITRGCDRALVTGRSIGRSRRHYLISPNLNHVMRRACRRSTWAGWEALSSLGFQIKGKCRPDDGDIEEGCISLKQRFDAGVG
jgi:hypothetical protein